MSLRSSTNETPDLTILVKEIQAGRQPEENFQRIFDRYCRPVTNFFANRGFSPAEAEELAQETFIRVYNHIGTFRLDASFKTWLFRIVGNIWKNALRDRSTLKRQAETVTLDEIAESKDEQRGDAAPEPEDPEDDPLTQTLAEERTQKLMKAIGKLPPKMQECVLLRVGRDLKYEEIADVLQVSVSTVKSQLNAAKKRLKPILETSAELFDL